MMQRGLRFLIPAILSALAPFALNAQDATQEIVIPAIPQDKITVPQVPTIKVIYEEDVNGTVAVKQTVHADVSRRLDRSIVFSKRVPPGYGENKKYIADKQIGIGEVNNGRVSLYLRGPLISVDDAKSRLKIAGFKVLGTFAIDKKKKLTSIVFTHPVIENMATCEGKGFAASLRMLVDKINNQISVINPVYQSRAFMQDKYDADTVVPVLKDLRGAFEGLKESEDRLKFNLLPKYHFMAGLPFYNDMITVGVGDEEALLNNARSSKKVVFEQPLPNGGMLIGVKLGRRTMKFVKKIGYQNAGLLPYTVLIEEGKAKILEPKYYIALMYPMLTMSDFMTIATVPGAIERDCSKIFR